MLKAVIGAIVVAIVIIIAFVVFGGVILGLSHATDMLANAVNIAPRHKFLEMGNEVFMPVAFIAGLVVAGVFLILAIHVKKR